MPRPTAPPLAVPRDAPGRRSFERTDNHHGDGKNYVDKSTPINSAVTGLNFPTPYTERPPAPEPFSTPQGSSDGSFDAPLTPPDFESLDQLWDSLRHEKELKEAKSRPKVKSLEGPDHSPPPRANAPVRPAAPVVENTKQVLKKKSSHCTFRESPDGTTVTAIFDLPGIKKQDVHISYQRNRLVVTWQTVHVTEREEDGRLVRESRENKESRTIPLPEGTKFEEVHANMDRRLTLTYPNMRSVRAHARPKAQGTSPRPQPS